MKDLVVKVSTMERLNLCQTQQEWNETLLSIFSLNNYNILSSHEVVEESKREWMMDFLLYGSHDYDGDKSPHTEAVCFFHNQLRPSEKRRLKEPLLRDNLDIVLPYDVSLW